MRLLMVIAASRHLNNASFEMGASPRQHPGSLRLARPYRAYKKSCLARKVNGSYLFPLSNKVVIDIFLVQYSPYRLYRYRDVLIRKS